MNSYTKIKLGVGITLLVSIFIIVYAFITSIHTSENRGILNAIELVDINNNDNIETLRKNGSNYAIRVQEDGKYFLKLFLFNGTLFDGVASYKEVKLSLSIKQSDKVTEGNKYWLDVQFYGLYPEWTAGKVKNIYSYNPVR